MKWFIDLTEKQKEETKYIFLYADEYDKEVWEDYCDILGVPYSSFEIKVQVCGVNVLDENKDE